MAQQTLNIGSNANDGTGDTLRVAMQKVNENFTEVYSSPGITSDALSITGNEISAVRSNDDIVFNPAGTGSITMPALRFNDNNIEGTRSNENINLLPSGSGSVVFGALKIQGTTLSSDDSTAININDGLVVDGTMTVSGAVTLGGATNISSTLSVPSALTTLNSLTVTGTTTLAGTTTVDNITFNDNIIGTSSNADLNLTPGGTGIVVISNLTVDSNINITDNTIKATASNSNLQLSASGSGTVLVTSGLTTAAVTTVGNVDVTGTETITGQLNVDGVTIKDNTISSNSSNANLEISANGSGNIVMNDVDIGGGNIDNTVIGGSTPLAGTFTTLSTTASLTIDGVTISDNTVSSNASNANLELSGNGSGGVTISGFTFPTSDGSSGQFLKTDGLGNLAFATAGATLSHSVIADATTTVATSTTSTLNTFDKTVHRSAKYFISVSDSTNSRFEFVEANVIHDGTDAYLTTYGSVSDYTTGLATYSVDISGDDVRLRVTNISNDSTVFKFQRIAIVV